MLKGEDEAAQLFKREMDRGSEQGTNIPLQQAHNSASICTPLSLPPIHHSLTAPTSRFHLISRYPPCLSPKLASYSCADGILQFLKHTRCHSPRTARHLPLSLRSACGQGACAETWAASGWPCGWAAASETLWTTRCACVSSVSLARVMITHF